MNGAGKVELGVSWERYAQRVEELIKEKGVFKHCTAIAFAALVPLAALGGAARQASAALVIFAVAFPKSIAGLVGLDNKFPETYTMRQVGFRIVKMLAHAKVAAKTTAYFPVVFVYPKTVVKEYRTLRSDPLYAPAPSTHTPVEPPLPAETSAKPFLKTPSASTVGRIKEWIGAHPTYSTIGLGIAAVGALALAGYGISILVSGDQIADPEPTNSDVFNPYGQAANKSEPESFQNIFQGNSHQTTTNLTDLPFSGQNSDINSGLSTGISLDVLGTDGASSDELSLVALEGEYKKASDQLISTIAATEQLIGDCYATLWPHAASHFAQSMDHTDFIQNQGNGAVTITNSHVFNPYGQAANNLDAESFQNILQGNSHQITTNLTDPSLSGQNSDINSGLSTVIGLDVLEADGASSYQSGFVALEGEGNDVSDQLIGGSDPIIWPDTASDFEESIDHTAFIQNEDNEAVTIATLNSVSETSANSQIIKSNLGLNEIIRLFQTHEVRIDQSTTVTDQAASNKMDITQPIGDISGKGSLSIVSETATTTTATTTTPSGTTTVTPSQTATTTPSVTTTATASGTATTTPSVTTTATASGTATTTPSVTTTATASGTATATPSVTTTATPSVTTTATPSLTTTTTASGTATATPLVPVFEEDDPSDGGGEKNQTSTFTSAITSITPSPSIISPTAMGPTEATQSQTNDKGASTSWMSIVGVISTIVACVPLFNCIRKPKGSPANSKILRASPADVAKQKEWVKSFKDRALRDKDVIAPALELVDFNLSANDENLLVELSDDPRPKSTELVTIFTGGRNKVFMLKSVPKWVFKPMSQEAAVAYVNMADQCRQVVQENQLTLLKVPCAITVNVRNCWFVAQEKEKLMASTYEDVREIYTSLWQDQNMLLYMRALFTQLICFICKTGFSDVKYDNIAFTEEGKVALFDLDTLSTLLGLTKGKATGCDGIFNYLPADLIDEFLEHTENYINGNIFEEVKSKIPEIKNRVSKSNVMVENEKYEEFARKNSLTCSSQQINVTAAVKLFNGNQAKLAELIIADLNKHVAESNGFTKRSGRQLLFNIESYTRSGDSYYEQHGEDLYSKNYGSFKNAFIEILEKLKENDFIYHRQDQGSGSKWLVLY